MVSVYLRLLFLCPLFLFTAGCWGIPPVEKVGFIQHLGVEEETDGKFLVSGLYPLVGSQREEILFTAKAHLLQEGLIREEQSSSRVVTLGKTQMIFFSEQLAAGGITPLLTIFHRDPINPPIAAVVVTEGSPRELLTRGMSFSRKLPLSIYLNQLLQQNIGHYIPDSHIFRFNTLNFASGLDPVATLVGMGDKDVEIRGTALFFGDRMVGKLGPDDGTLLLAMMGQLKPDTLYFLERSNEPAGTGKKTATTHIGVVFHSVRRKIKLQIKDGRPEIGMTLKFGGVLVSESPWDHLDDPKAQKALETQLNASLQKSCRRVAAYLQQIGSDPVGIGDLIRAKAHDYWKSAGGEREVYRKSRILVLTELDISHFGAVK